jgi:hypothetical protein
MEWVAAKKLIKQRWMDQWGTVGGGVLYVFDNDVQKEGTPGYVRVVIRNGRSEQITIGDHPKYRRNGTLDLICHRPLNEGDKEIDSMVQLARNVFERKRFGPPGDDSIICYKADYLDPDKEGQYRRQTVSITFHFYEVT